MRLARRRQGRDADAQPAGQEEPPHLRELRRDRQHLPRRREGQGREGLRHHRRRRQFLLRRRRVRDHRPAGRDGHGRPARIHPHDRRGREGDAPMPAADRRGDRRRVRGRRRDPRDGVRPAHRHREGQGRVPVQPRGPGRLRHGRVRDPAAHHRPGPRLGTALHRPRDERRGSRALGLLQPARRARSGARRGDRSSRASSPTARPSPTA